MTMSGAPQTHNRRSQIVAWCLWDFGSNAFNTVMLSFVFSVYITSTVASDPDQGQTVFGNAQTIAGIAVAILAPMMGTWADRARNRRLMLSVSTTFIAICLAACWFVEPQAQFLWLGAGLLAAASVIQDIAEVFYNGMLLDIAKPASVGRISGIAWGLGYAGGVIGLVVSLFGFILGGFGLPSDNAVNARAVALFCAAWLFLWSLPIMIIGPSGAQSSKAEEAGRFHPLLAYRDIGLRLAHMWRNERGMLHFLVASAIYRDGLAAIFTFAGVIAANAFGFTPDQVIIFGIAANVMAAIGTWVLGWVDDRFGPRPTILFCLVSMIVFGVVIVVANSSLLFWIFGLGISTLVGGLQSASRTLLARIVPEGEANESFGLYATVGRSVSFLAPSLVTFFTAVMGARWGMLGIVVVLALGLALFWPLRIGGVTHGRVVAAD